MKPSTHILRLGILLAWNLVPVCGALPATAQNLPPPSAPKPMTLEESIEVALGHSAQARVARFARDVAQTQADRQRPIIRPTLEARTTETVQGPGAILKRENGSDIIFLQEHAAQAGIVFVQPLYQPGFIAAQQRYAAQVSVVEMDYRRQLVDLAQSVNRAYLDVLRAEAGLRTAQDGLEAAQRAQSLAQRQVAAGVAKPIDAQIIAAHAQEAQSGVEQAESGLTLARGNFNRLLSRPLDMPVSLEPVRALPEIPDSPDTAILIALHNRPELIGLEQNVRAAHAGIALARTQVQPAFSVRGEYSEQTPTALIHEHYAAAMLEMRWPILDAGKSNLDIQEASAQTKRLEALLEDTRQGIAFEVKSDLEKMRQARARITTAQAQRKSQEDILAVAEKAYEVGRGTIYEVEGAQRDLHAARERELQATYDLYGAQLDFNYAQGVGAASLEIYFPPRQMRRNRKTAAAPPPAETSVTDRTNGSETP